MQNPDDRRAGYAADITYCTNKQVTFDYLRDRVTIGARRDPLYRVLDKLNDAPAQNDGLLLRGLCFAIIDEADSVLIDEARTPLKLSAANRHGARRSHIPAGCFRRPGARYRCGFHRGYRHRRGHSARVGGATNRDIVGWVRTRISIHGEGEMLLPCRL